MNLSALAAIKRLRLPGWISREPIRRCVAVLGILTQTTTMAVAAEPPVAQRPPTNAVPLTPALINQMAEEMRTNHHGLQALSARLRAAQEATNTVRTWEDPTFTFGGAVASSRGSNLREDGDLIYGLDQKLPLFGKARAAREVAHAEAEVEIARHTTQFQNLRRDLAKALFQLARFDRALELGAEDLAWLERAVAAAEEQYRAGTGRQIDVLRLQNERARRAELLRTDAARRNHQQLAVNRLLSRDLQSPLPPLILPPVAQPIVYTQSLAEMASRFEPKLRQMEKETRQAEAAWKVARRASWPDVSAGIEGRQYSGDGGFREGTFLLSLNLPWLNRRALRSEVSRTAGRMQASELEVADYKLSVQQDLHQLIVNIDAARRDALLYGNEILPRARTALESAYASWQANQGSLTDLLEARRMVIEAQLAQTQAITEQYQAMAELALYCGLGDLEALEARGILEPNSP